MLKLEPKERITIVEVSNDKWLNGNIDDRLKEEEEERQLLLKEKQLKEQ